jgi:hypothetical protein
LFAFFCLRLRKRQGEAKAQQDTEKADALVAQRGHELLTAANTHEIDGKTVANSGVVNISPHRAAKEIQELEPSKSPTVVEIGTTNDKSTTRLAFTSKAPVPSNTYTTNIGLDCEHFQPSELDNAPPPAELPSQPTDLGTTYTYSEPASTSMSHTPQLQNRRIPNQTSSSVPAQPSKVGGKLDVLRKRIKIVQEEKERLEKIQQLKELETELQRELIEEQRKTEAACL